MTNLPISKSASDRITQIESIIGKDEGGRGMESLIVPGDLEQAAKILARLQPMTPNRDDNPKIPSVIILSGFPCCINHDPPTETDGPPGAIAIARCALALGYQVILVTDECNKVVFQAACDTYNQDSSTPSSIRLEVFPGSHAMGTKDEERMKALVQTKCDLIIACERAGPAEDGNCYTMRGIDMTSKGLIAPLHQIVEIAREYHEDKVKFIAIGDGGNEMGMGKVIDIIQSNPKIQNGSLIGAVTKADYLIAASVSNWGGYALAAASAIVRQDDVSTSKNEWVEKCVPTEEDEVKLLDAVVSKGCRDGVSGEMEATVDGMPLETSLSCLRSIRDAALKEATTTT